MSILNRLKARPAEGSSWLKAQGSRLKAGERAFSLQPRAFSQVSLEPRASSLERSSRGQALLELAIVGSLIVVLLGWLVNYALRADFEQYGQMESFRAALAMTSEPLDDTLRGAGNVLILRDRHVPDPAHPFAVGQVTPITGSASATRDVQMYRGPIETSHLPRVRLNLDGQPFDCGSAGGSCATAGFRDEPGFESSSEQRYKLIYSAVCTSPDCGTSPAVCTEWETVTDPDPYAGGQTSTNCVRYTMSVRVLDACEGEIINYDICTKQARMIVDSAMCERECRKEKPVTGGFDYCATICAQAIKPPWYAQDAVQSRDGRWIFPRLDALFAGTGSRMGLQPGSVTVVRADHRMDKTESPAAITTTASGSSVHEITRTMVWSPLAEGGTRVQARDEHVTRTKEVKTENSWTVNW